MEVKQSPTLADDQLVNDARWLYIVCGCMTVPCGLGLLFVLPDLPNNTRAFYLSQEERSFTLERAKSLGKVRLHEYQILLRRIRRSYDRASRNLVIRSSISH